MWSRFKAFRSFNKFLVLVLLTISVIILLEIFGKISGGTEITGDDYRKYAWFWASFLFGFIFINFVDFIVRALSGNNVKS